MASDASTIVALSVPGVARQEIRLPYFAENAHVVQELLHESARAQAALVAASRRVFESTRDGPVVRFPAMEWKVLQTGHDRWAATPVEVAPWVPHAPLVEWAPPAPVEVLGMHTYGDQFAEPKLWGPVTALAHAYEAAGATKMALEMAEHALSRARSAHDIAEFTAHKLATEREYEASKAARGAALNVLHRASAPLAAAVQDAYVSAGKAPKDVDAALRRVGALEPGAVPIMRRVVDAYRRRAEEVKARKSALAGGVVAAGGPPRGVSFKPRDKRATRSRRSKGTHPSRRRSLRARRHPFQKAG
jgi:hypothetical protein